MSLCRIHMRSTDICTSQNYVDKVHVCGYPPLSYAEGHDRVDNVVVVLLQSLDGLLPADVCLGHDEFDVFGFETGVVDLFAVIFFFLLGLFRVTTLDGLALVAVIVIMTGVISGRLCGKLLRGTGLGGRVEVFNLGLSEDAVDC